jgi:NTE family protein
MSSTRIPSLLLIALFTLSSCVSRPPRDPEQGPPPPSTTQAPPPSSSPGASPSEAPVVPGPSVKSLQGPVTVVLGGAGVASFATIGILKKLQEDGVKIDAIIATGWPALFAVGYGTMKSVHDLEWFATRLEESDFASGGLFGSDKGFSEHERLRATVTKAFGNTNLNQTRVPIVISSSNSSSGQPEIFSSGNWLDPLLKAVSVPGTFRPYGEGPGLGWVSALSGVDVEEAHRRGARTILAFAMYDDFLVSLQDYRTKESETLFRNLFAAQLHRSIRTSMKRASAGVHIRLGRPANEFSAKRLAMQLGYQETSKLLRSVANKN